MPAQVLIELIPDVSKVESAIDQLSKNGSVSNGDAAAFKAGNAELAKRNTLLAQQQQAENKHLATIGQVQKAASSLSDTVVKGTLNAISSLEKQQNTVNLLQKSLDSLKAKNASITVIANVTKALDLQKAKLQELENAEKSETQATESLRAEKKRLQAQIAELIIAGQQESETFNQLTTRAGEIDDAMKDASDAIARTGSDTRGIDTTIQLAQGLTAGFTIATSAAALFGDESEATQQVLLKVNAAMALLNGLQEIQNLLKSEYLKSLAATIFTQQVQNAQIITETGLQSANIVVKTAATVAQKSLNAAMIANPFGIFVAIITTAITAVAAYTQSTSAATRNQISLENAIASTTTRLDVEIQAFDNFSKKRTADLEASGARQSQIAAEEVRNLRAQQTLRVEQYDALNKFITLVQSRGLEIDKQYGEKLRELQDKITQANIEGQVKVTQLNKQLLDESNGDAIAAADNAVKIAKNGSAQEIAAKANAAKVKRDIALKQLSTQVGDEKAISAQRQAIEADYTEAVQGLANEAIDRAKATNQKRIAAEKEAIDNLLIAVREGSAEQLKIQEDSIRKQAQLDQAGVETRNVAADIVAKERANIENKANAEIAKLRKDFAKKDAKDQADIELAQAQARVAAFREGTDEYYVAQRQFLSTQAVNEQLGVEQSTDSESVKAGKILLINANLNKALSDLNRQQLDEQIASQRAAIDALNSLALSRAQNKAADPRLNEAQQFTAEQDARTEQLRQIDADRARIEEDYQQGRIKSFQDYQAALTNNTRDSEKARLDIIYANLQREKELRKSISQEFFTVVTTAITDQFESEKALRDQNLQEALEALSQEKDYALTVKNLTERQKADIEKKYNNDTARLKTEAARKERKAQREQIIVNGLVAIAKTFADYGFTPVGLVAAAAQGLATLQALSKLDSTPLPAYAKGTRNAKRGPALVGEEGPEIVWMNGGEGVSTARESAHMMKTNDSLRALLTGDHSEAMAGHNRSQAIDYDLLAKAIVENMPKAVQPITVHNNLDKEGYTSFILEANSKRTIQNQRYTTGG